MEILKSWPELTLFNNTVRDYALAAFNLIALVIILMLSKRLVVRHLGKLAAKTANDFDDFIVSLLAQVGAPVFVAVSLYFVTLPLHMEEQVRAVIRYALVIVVTLRAIFILQDVIKYGIGKSYRRSRPNDPAAEPVIKNLTNVVQWAVWALAVVFVLDNLGINISALVAGLGIGGIAVALAAQAVLGDLFSALSIFVDKPFLDRNSLFQCRRRVSRAHVLGKCARNSAAFWRMTVFRFYARPLWSRDRFALASPSHRRCGSAFMHTLITSRPRTHATINRATACCAG